MVEIWREIYNNTPQNERESKNFRLPPIISAVLYNGANNWTAASTFKEMISSYQEFAGYILDFSYILFDVNRYSEEDLVKAANVIASIFLLDQKARPETLVMRLQKLAEAIKTMTPDEFRHITTWLKHIIKPKMPSGVQAKVDSILEANNPMEVEQMISNLEIALDEMKQETLLQGKLEGKLEVAKNLLLLNVDVNTIIRATGLNLEEINTLKRQLEH
jgi:predicted transposase/invertase (TIGR01784 family)